MTGTVGALLSVLAALLLCVAAGADETPAPFPSLERSEVILYGAPQAGGLVPRLSRMETELFGRELPGSLAERQQALLDYLEKGTPEQPSFLFKLGVLEWGVSQQIRLDQPAAARVENLEQVLSGKAEQGPLGMRVEKLVQQLLAGPIRSATVNVPAVTVFKVRLLQTLTVRVSRKNDPVKLETAEDIVVNGYLVAPKGSRVLGHISEVKGPRSFGRSSEISVAFENLYPLGQQPIPVLIGDAAKHALQVDKSLAGAAGASLAGLALLGPFGLAGGFLVRGDDKQIPSGTLFYLETGAPTMVQAFEIPPSLRGLVASPTPPPPATK
jgi:hypothetical protein